MCLYCFLFILFQILWSKHFFKNNSALFDSYGWKKRINFLFKTRNRLVSEKKRSKMFQVKVISNNVRKTIVPSFMFLFNLLKSVILCLNKENVNIIQFLPLNGPHWTNEITNKCTWFSCKIFVFYRKWKIKNVAVLHVWSAAQLEAFLLKQGMLFLARL